MLRLRAWFIDYFFLSVKVRKQMIVNLSNFKVYFYKILRVKIYSTQRNVITNERDGIFTRHIKTSVFKRMKQGLREMYTL